MRREPLIGTLSALCCSN